MPESCTLTTADGLSLEGEYAPAEGPPADAPRAGAVLCHPHPQYGGTMRSIVISALFAALPAQGIACVRFNFRGVEASEGTHSEGRDEPLDAVAAIDYLAARVPATAPVAAVGWSFGGDIALALDDARLAGWVAIAPPLRFHDGRDTAAGDPRPKLLVLAANDEFRDAGEVTEEVAGWTNTRVEVVAGASHFFVGRTDRVVTAVGGFFDALPELR